MHKKYVSITIKSVGYIAACLVLTIGVFGAVNSSNNSMITPTNDNNPINQIAQSNMRTVTPESAIEEKSVATPKNEKNIKNESKFVARDDGAKINSDKPVETDSFAEGNTIYFKENENTKSDIEVLSDVAVASIEASAGGEQDLQPFDIAMARSINPEEFEKAEETEEKTLNSILYNSQSDKNEIYEKVKQSMVLEMEKSEDVEYYIDGENAFLELTGEEKAHINEDGELIITFEAGEVAREELGEVQFNLGVIE